MNTASHAIPPLVDPFARAISYLRVSVTDRCDFRCVYCMSESMTFLPKKELLTLEELERMCSTFVRLDVEMVVGDTVIYGRIAIRVLECRFPSDDPASDAYAHLEILDLPGNRLFDGWMIASSPALNALEHPRHDVWVLRCFAE